MAPFLRFEAYFLAFSHDLRVAGDPLALHGGCRTRMLGGVTHDLSACLTSGPVIG